MSSEKIKIPKTKKFENLCKSLSMATREDLLLKIHELEKQNVSNCKTIQKLKDDLAMNQSTLEEIALNSQLGKIKRATGRSLLFAKNKDLLERSISVFEDFLGEPFIPTDFIKFQRFVISAFPVPEYIPTPRLTRAEKRLRTEEQQEILELKKRLGWSQSNLRKFFQERTGVKPATKKLL